MLHVGCRMLTGEVNHSAQANRGAPPRKLVSIACPVWAIVADTEANLLLLFVETFPPLCCFDVVFIYPPLFELRDLTVPHRCTPMANIRSHTRPTALPRVELGPANSVSLNALLKNC